MQINSMYIISNLIRNISIFALNNYTAHNKGFDEINYTLWPAVGLDSRLQTGFTATCSLGALQNDLLSVVSQ